MEYPFILTSSSVTGHSRLEPALAALGERDVTPATAYQQVFLGHVNTLRHMTNVTTRSCNTRQLQKW